MLIMVCPVLDEQSITLLWNEATWKLEGVRGRKKSL
jgi:hypothetical protein